jgi:BirA family biotin operon repressor/biotin-[acetyl-CoA-carboxylase] ligase
MRLLTDCPDTASMFAPAVQWRATTLSALPRQEQMVWRALGTGPALWSAEAGEGPRLVVIIDDAPASQFAALQLLINVNVNGAEALPSGLISLALTGRGFRGQRERSWQALRGNLHLCAYYRLDLPAAEVQAGLNMLPVVAAARGIEALSQGGLKPAIKWVNDLLLMGRKVAGVLCSAQIQGERVVGALFGIGINLAQAPALLEQPAACLAEHDAALADLLPQLAWAVVNELEAGLELLGTGNAEALYRHYLERAVFLGRYVTLWPDSEAPEPLARGRVVRLNPDLSLVLAGYEQPFRSGRMRLES